MLFQATIPENIPLTILYGAPLVIAACVYVIYQCFFAPLAHFPGPFPAKLTRFWYAWRTRNGLFHHEIRALHAKYGSAVRIAPDELQVVSDSFICIQ